MKRSQFKWKRTLFCICATILLLLFATGVNIALAGQSFKIKAQTYAIRGTVGYKAQALAAEHLKAATGGRLSVQLHGSGTIVNDFKMFEACSKGILDAIHIPGAFAASMDPGFAAIFSLPGLWQSTKDVRIWLQGYGGKEILKKGYAKYKLHYVASTLVGAEPIMSKFPIRTLEDFKDKKIRTPAGITSMLFARLGAKPVPISGAELYSAMQTGVVDACEFVSVSENFHAGLHEVSKYILWPSFHGPIAVVDWVVNEKVWARLPEDLKAAFELMVYEGDYRYDVMSAAADYEALNKMKEKGLIHIQLSPEEMKKVQEICVEVAREYARKSALADEVINSVLDYMKAIGRFH